MKKYLQSLFLIISTVTGAQAAPDRVPTMDSTPTEESYFEGSFLPKTGGQPSKKIRSVYDNIFNYFYDFAYANFFVFSFISSLDAEVNGKPIEDALPKIIKSPVKVKVFFKEILPDFGGYKLRIQMTSPDFQKFLSTGSSNLDLTADARLETCDGLETVAFAELGNDKERLVKALEKIHYTLNKNFRCNFTIHNVIFGDSPAIGSLGNRSWAFNDNDSNFRPHADIDVFRSTDPQRTRGIPDSDVGTQTAWTSLSLVDNQRLLMQYHYNLHHGAWQNPYDNFRGNGSMTLIPKGKALVPLTKDEMTAAEKSVADLLDMLDKYRRAMVIASALEGPEAVKHMKLALEMVLKDGPPLVKDLNEHLKELDVMTRIYASRTLHNAVADMALIEVKLKLLEDPLHGIGDLEIHKQLE